MLKGSMTIKAKRLWLWVCSVFSSKHWNRYSFRFAPSVSKSLMDGCVWNSVFLRPVHDRHGYISYCYQVIRPSVFRLILLRYPFAVFFGVILIVINSFDRISDWAFPHIFKESFELFPFLRVSDSTTAPILKVPDVGVVAPSFHLGPGSISGRMVSFCESVFQINICDCLPSHASAGLGMAGRQFVSIDRFGFSAGAPTYPVVISGNVLVHNCKSSKCLACFDLVHGWAFTI